MAIFLSWNSDRGPMRGDFELVKLERGRPECEVAAVASIVGLEEEEYYGLFIAWQYSLSADTIFSIFMNYFS